MVEELKISLFMKNHFLVLHKFYIKFVVLLFILFFTQNLYAQKEDYNWVLYNHLRVDFNQEPPLIATDVPTLVGNFTNLTSMSDDLGNLLFYINGTRLYNYNHQLIFTTPTVSLSNQVNVVPHPTDAKKYFWFVPIVFPERKFVIYTIDMNANSGLGSVTETYSFIGAETPKDFVISRKSNSADYWFIRIYSDNVVVNSLSSTGLNNATTYNLALGENSNSFKVTPDMSTIFVRVSATALYALDINSRTGEIQNFRSIFTQTSGIYYYFEFSRNNEYVYIASQNNSTRETKISQFSLHSLSNETEFLNSEVVLYHQTLDSNYPLRDMQIAPNNKIYITFNDYYLWSIDNPDLPYPSCVVNNQSLWLNGAKSGGYLPNYFYYYANFNYQTFCNAVYFNYIGAAATLYSWNFGDNHTSTELDPTHTYATAGTYTVTLEVTFTDSSTQTITKDIEIFEKPLKPIIEHE